MYGEDFSEVTSLTVFSANGGRILVRRLVSRETRNFSYPFIIFPSLFNQNTVDFGRKKRVAKKI